MKTSKSVLIHVVIYLDEPVAAFGSLDDMISYLDFCIVENRKNLFSFTYYNSSTRRRCSMSKFLYEFDSSLIKKNYEH